MLGQAYDVNGNVCVPPAWLDPNGLCTTQAGATASAQESSAPYECNWLQKLFDASGCASAASPVPPLPAPAPPSTSITVGGTDPNMQGDSYQAGTDAAGNPIYVNTPSAQQIHAAQVQQITSQVASGYVDCSSIWNQLTNSACPCIACQNSTTYIGIAVFALAALWVVTR